MHPRRTLLFEVALSIAFLHTAFSLPSGAPSFEAHGQSRSNSLPLRRHRHEARRTRSVERRDGGVGAIGLGDDFDFSYTVSMQIGSITTALNLDTGSSDLWAISSACGTVSCRSTKAPAYPIGSFKPAQNGPSVLLQYGDSTTGTHATGPIGIEDVSVAGLGMQGQAFVAVNDTDNTSVNDGAAGIWGVGFPAGSVVQSQIIYAESLGSTSDALFNSIATSGPLLSRMAEAGVLDEPMFTISLQRDTIDKTSSFQGQLTLGTLPNGVSNTSLTWLPVRLYTPDEGGISPPSFAPNEVYPLRWEVPLDGVLLDGTTLAGSAIQGATSQLSALIDTGNSILRGPADVVQTIYSAFSTSSAGSQALYPCSKQHILAFQFGGKQFPVDARDFLSPASLVQQKDGDGDEICDAGGNLVSTDPPSRGTLFSWSLGDTFLKSTLVAFYYGNLTHPSIDPPRIGFLSLVGSDNGVKEAQQDVQSADRPGQDFLSTTNAAPTSTVPLSAPPKSSSSSYVGAPSSSGSESTTKPAATGNTGLNANEGQKNGTMDVRIHPAQHLRNIVASALMALTFMFIL